MRHHRDIKTAGRNCEKKKATGAFIMHRLELLESPAFRCIPKTLRKIIDRLELEHLRHGGAENGHLRVSYNQFVEFGISKRTIQPSLLLGVQLGLLKIGHLEQGARQNIRPDNTYCLTYVASKGWKNATDEWRTVTEEQARKLLHQFQQCEKQSVKAPVRLAA